MLEHTCIPSTLEVEAARSEVRGQPERHVTVTYDENLTVLENVLPRSVALWWPVAMLCEVTVIMASSCVCVLHFDHNAASLLCFFTLCVPKSPSFLPSNPPVFMYFQNMFTNGKTVLT